MDVDKEDVDADAQQLGQEELLSRYKRPSNFSIMFLWL